MRHHLVRSGCVLAAASLAALATGPAFAADPVARASATALQIGVAGQGTDTGTYTATDDGSGETTSGSNRPALPVLAGQRLTNLGTLAQDAVTQVAGGAGSSAACSGIAGEGATLAQVGDGTGCLVGGQTISLDAAHADFSKLRVLPTEITQGYDTAFAAALAPVVTPVVTQALRALGDPALGVDLGATQSFCTASTDGTDGSATIADATAYVTMPAPIGRVDLVDLPVHPAPNTTVPVDLTALTEAVQRAVDDQLGSMLGGTGGPLGALTLPAGQTVDSVVDQLQSNVTDALGPQLAPLEQALTIELNKQAHPSAGAIEVTALDLSVLPAAQDFVGADLASLVVGHVTCGPGGRVAPVLAAAPPVHAATPGRPGTAVPTAVESGAASLEDGPSPLALAGLGGLVVAGLGAGAWGYRRSLHR